MVYDDDDAHEYVRVTIVPAAVIEAQEGLDYVPLSSLVNHPGNLVASCFPLLGLLEC